MAKWSAADPPPLHPVPARLIPVGWAPPSLPADFGGFVGREREIETVVAALTVDGARLVTLTGLGGVGKTRLALRVAAHYGNVARVGFVSLAALRDPGAVVSTIRHQLGIAGDGAPLESLRGAIGHDPCLLVLDNFEHLVEAAPAMLGLLTACPALSLLVASRRPLHLQGEREIPIAPLPVPDPACLPALPELARIASVALFVQRARAADPAFALAVDNAAPVAAICARVAGLPLAIELAAAWTKVLPPAALLTRLSPQLPLLVGGGPDQPVRLRTMRDAIAWSYDLLSVPTQRLFRYLSVFPAGAPLDAIERVGGIEALPRLADLVEAGLIRRQGDNEAPRFVMLEPIREFALACLAASGEHDDAHDRLLAWLLHRAQRPGWSWDVPHGGDDGDWFAGWERDLDNVRAALAWAERRGETEQGLHLAGALFLFWWTSRHLEEGRRWLEQGLAAPVAASAHVRALALAVLSALAHRRDDNDEAARLAAAAEALWNAAGATGDCLGLASYLLAISAYRRGDLDDAERRYAATLDRLRTADNPPLRGEALLGLAQVARDRGDLQRSATRYGEALALQELHGIRWGRSLACYGAGTVAHLLGHLPEALSRYRESLRYWHEIADWGSVAVCLEAIASAVCGLGEARRAASLLGAAQALREAAAYPIPDRSLPSYGRVVAGVYGCLGPAAFCEAWLAGRALSIDAVAEACRPEGRSARRPVAPRRRPLRAPFGLSPREVEVLRLVAAGRTDKEIAEALSISHRTVTTHVSHLLGKLGVSSRVEAAAWAVRSLLAPPTVG